MSLSLASILAESASPASRSDGRRCGQRSHRLRPALGRGAALRRPIARHGRAAGGPRRDSDPEHA